MDNPATVSTTTANTPLQNTLQKTRLSVNNLHRRKENILNLASSMTPSSISLLLTANYSARLRGMPRIALYWITNKLLHIICSSVRETWGSIHVQSLHWSPFHCRAPTPLPTNPHILRRHCRLRTITRFDRRFDRVGTNISRLDIFRILNKALHLHSRR